MSTENEVINDFTQLFAFTATGNLNKWGTEIGSKINNLMNHSMDVYLNNIVNKNISGTASITIDKILGSGTFKSPYATGGEFKINESGLSISKQLDINDAGGQIILKSAGGNVFSISVDEAGILQSAPIV